MTNLKELKLSELHKIASEYKVKYYKLYFKAELIQHLENLQQYLVAEN
jgi:hypothetical protein